MGRALLCFGVLSLILASAPGAYGDVIWFNDFSTTTGLQLNGNAIGNVNNGLDPPVLRLAPALVGQAGSAFTSSTVDVSSFVTSFAFRITNAGGASDSSGLQGADGLTFTIQTTGSGALGFGGGGLGYGGILSSVALEIDTWDNGLPSDPDSNHIGFDSNGSLNSFITVAVPGQFDDGNLHLGSLTYDGTTLFAQVDAAITSWVVDIPATIGSSNAYVGFTASTGGAIGDHDIVSWHYSSDPIAAPEPGAIACWIVVTIVGGSMCLRRRRRTS